MLVNLCAYSLYLSVYLSVSFFYLFYLRGEYQSVLFQAARPIHEKQRKEKTHKHTVVKQTDRQTDIKIMYNNMAGAACAVPLQEHCYMRTICY